MVNGFNLGRYWPVIGPQVTMYLPKELLNVGSNEITLVELQRAPTDKLIHFTDNAILDEA